MNPLGTASRTPSASSSTASATLPLVIAQARNPLTRTALRRIRRVVHHAWPATLRLPTCGRSCHDVLALTNSPALLPIAEAQARLFALAPRVVAEAVPLRA